MRAHIYIYILLRIFPHFLVSFSNFLQYRISNMKQISVTLTSGGLDGDKDRGVGFHLKSFTE